MPCDHGCESLVQLILILSGGIIWYQAPGFRPLFLKVFPFFFYFVFFGRMDEIVAAVHGHMDQMTTLFESLRGEIRKQWNGGSSGKFMDPIIGFIHAVDWTEPWLIMLILFHFMLLILAITTRKNSNFQMALFLAALMGVYFAEKINYILGRNWKSFAGQNYFDHHGVFLSNVWSGPLLIISTTVLINTLITLSQLIVKWKRAELKHRAHLSRQKME